MQQEAPGGEALEVWIDQDLCTGDGICAQYAPEVFELDIDGLAYVKGADDELLQAPGGDRAGAAAAAHGRGGLGEGVSRRVHPRTQGFGQGRGVRARRGVSAVQTLWAPAGVERRKALPFHRHVAGVFTSGQQRGTASEGNRAGSR